MLLLYNTRGGQEGEKQQGKLFWSECLAFVTSNTQMQKGHAVFLEVEFYKKAYDAGRYILENGNIPSDKTVSESDEIFCDDFLEDCDLLSSLMGIPLFTPLEKSTRGTESGSERLEINNESRRGLDDPRYVNAKGHLYKTDEYENGFMVLQESIIAKEVTKKASPTIKKLRRELKKRGYVKEIDGKLVFQKEYVFMSAGIAASVVLGRNASAKEWKEI